MTSLELVVEYTAETIHPMQAFACESPAVEHEVLLEGKADDGARSRPRSPTSSANARNAPKRTSFARVAAMLR